MQSGRQPPRASIHWTWLQTVRWRAICVYQGSGLASCLTFFSFASPPLLIARLPCRSLARRTTATAEEQRRAAAGGFSRDASMRWCRLKISELPLVIPIGRTPGPTAHAQAGDCLLSNAGGRGRAPCAVCRPRAIAAGKTPNTVRSALPTPLPHPVRRTSSIPKRSTSCPKPAQLALSKRYAAQESSWARRKKKMRLHDNLVQPVGSFRVVNLTSRVSAVESELGELEESKMVIGDFGVSGQRCPGVGCGGNLALSLRTLRPLLRRKVLPDHAAHFVCGRVRV